MLILIAPPKAHIKIELLSKTGLGVDIKFGFIGIHIPAGTGIHGPGVKTPKWDAVSAAVVGFAKLLHMTNGDIFKNGMQSMQVPSGPVGPITIFGNTVKTPGAIPKGQLNKDPFAEQKPIISLAKFQNFSFKLLSTFTKGEFTDVA